MVSVTEQEILKLFDCADAPFLTAEEIATELPFTKQAANRWLRQMYGKGYIDRKLAGGRSIGWWATVAPSLSDEARRRADAADPETAISLEELENEFADS